MTPASPLATGAFAVTGALGAELAPPLARGTVLSMEVPNAARPVAATDPRVSVPVLLGCTGEAPDGEEPGVGEVVVTADCPAAEESAGRLVSFFGAGRVAGDGALAVPGTAVVTPASVGAFSVVWRWIRL